MVDNWWKKSVEQKDYGFYVDYVNKVWISPQDKIKREDYIITYDIIVTVLNFVDILFNRLRADQPVKKDS